MELTVNIPEKYVVNRSPDELRLLLKLNTAIDMYRSGQISSGAALDERPPDHRGNTWAAGELGVIMKCRMERVWIRNTKRGR